MTAIYSHMTGNTHVTTVTFTGGRPLYLGLKGNHLLTYTALPDKRGLAVTILAAL